MGVGNVLLRFMTSLGMDSWLASTETGITTLKTIWDSKRTQITKEILIKCEKLQVSYDLISKFTEKQQG